MAACSDANLKDWDGEVYDLLIKEKQRQVSGIELIASENFTSKAVMECLGSCFTNKYSEGLPNARYYGGNENIDKLENICRDRALTAFNLDKAKWGVNVQPYSGSPANFAVYTGLLNPHDRIMGLALPSGGHLTHGYYTTPTGAGAVSKKVSATSIYFESLPYHVHHDTGLIDYDEMEKLAILFRPKLIVAGASAYPRDWDYVRIRSICDKVGAYMMSDMAHISGLVATGEANNPFDVCDVVTTTTHKSLRGPRSGMIFFRRGPKSDEPNAPMYEYENAINMAVFPGLQGGPHNHQIAGLATQLKEVATPEFKAYIQQVKKNAAALCALLVSKGYKMATNGTENHLMLMDLRPLQLTGSKAEMVLEAVHITLNKNSVHGDVSAITPGGVRIGAPAMTSRGLKEADFEQIGEFVHRGIQIGLEIQKKAGSKKLVDFQKTMKDDEYSKILADLKAEIESFSSKFFMPGH
jgi:glycine hydroxymethyltransferase